MNKKLIGIVIGLMIATSVVYFVETIEEFEEGDVIKGPFFLLVAAAYLPVAYWMTSNKQSSASYVVAIVGSIGLIALYALTRTDAATIFGMEVGKIGHLGIVSKTLQVGVVLGLVLALIQAKKESWLKPKEIKEEVKQ